MNLRRFIASSLKLLVLIAALSGIYYYWRVREPQDVIDDAKDDLLEITGDTYVAVHATSIEPRTLHRYIAAYGRVEAAPADARPAASASIGSPIVARVASVDCIEGQHVRAGETLFTLDHRAADAVLEADRIALEQARSRRTTMPTDATTPQWVSLQSERDVDLAALSLARDQAARDALTIAAPIDGVVTQLLIAPGNVADPGRVAVQLTDLNRLVIALDVPADLLKQIKVGDAAIGKFPGESKVTRVDAGIDPLSGLGSVDIEVPPNSSLRPGESAVARIAMETKPDCLVVPLSSVVMDDDGRPTIALVDSDGRWATQTVVTTGLREGDAVEVAGDAVQAGQSVVTTGAFGLNARTRIHLLRN